MEFMYDENGRPYAVLLNSTIYYYILNLQGDVVQVADSWGRAHATYTYNAWGKLLSAQAGSYSGAQKITNLNPLRYRGYVYDTETQLYYLQSRYYDPNLGRFLNADAFTSTGQGILGYNMYAYCWNNPVNWVDSSGYAPYVPEAGPNARWGCEIVEWFQETDEYGRDEDGILTLQAKAKRLLLLMWNNLELHAGGGMGYELSADILDVAAFSIGMHGDFLCVKLEDEQFSMGQELSAGITVTGFFHNWGYIETLYNKDFQPGNIEVDKGLWGDDTLTIVSGSFYCGVGGSFRIGFDIVSFCKDWNEIFS